MELKVLALTSPSDIPTIARIHLAAFLTNRFYRTVWPKGATPAVIASQESRHLNFLTSDPTVRYAKVVEYPRPSTSASASTSDNSSTDHEEGTIIAFAKWHIYTSSTTVETRQDASDRSWPPDCNVPCVEDFWSQLQAVRREWGPKLGPHLMLDILATDPAHMRRGAGKNLVGFGTDLADQMGLPCFLEGSPEGMGLYEACGFEVVGSIWVDLAKYQPDGGEEWPEVERGGEKQGGRVEGESWGSMIDHQGRRKDGSLAATNNDVSARHGKQAAVNLCQPPRYRNTRLKRRRTTSINPPTYSVKIPGWPSASFNSTLSSTAPAKNYAADPPASLQVMRAIYQKCQTAGTQWCRGKLVSSLQGQAVPVSTLFGFTHAVGKWRFEKGSGTGECFEKGNSKTDLDGYSKNAAPEELEVVLL